MKRRAFFSRIGAILATICMVPYLAGCNAITDLEHWIPVALSAVSSIVKLLGPIVSEANAAEEQRKIAQQWMDRAYKLGYQDP